MFGGRSLTRFLASVHDARVDEIGELLNPQEVCTLLDQAGGQRDEDEIPRRIGPRHDARSPRVTERTRRAERAEERGEDPLAAEPEAEAAERRNGTPAVLQADEVEEAVALLAGVILRGEIDERRAQQPR